MPDHQIKTIHVSGDQPATSSERVNRQTRSMAFGYPTRKKLLITNFWIGIMRGLGTVIGLTIGVAILIWVLSLFTHVPLIGPFVNNVKHTVNSYSQNR